VTLRIRVILDDDTLPHAVQYTFWNVRPHPPGQPMFKVDPVYEHSPLPAADLAERVPSPMRSTNVSLNFEALPREHGNREMTEWHVITTRLADEEG
jgi:hypothetical protein